MIGYQNKNGVFVPRFFSGLLKEQFQTHIAIMDTSANRVWTGFQFPAPVFRNKVRVMRRKCEKRCHERLPLFAHLMRRPWIEIFVQDSPRLVKMFIVIVFEATEI